MCCYGTTAAKCDDNFRLVQANMRHNWRTGKSIRNFIASDFDKVCLAAYSYSNENLPIAYVSEQPQCMLSQLYRVYIH
jgi:hypothetical protein